MNYISIENISKSFGFKVLFENLSFGIEQGQKLALIGLNGSGKSTLLRILAGVETPDTGRISIRKGIRMAYLPQEPDLPLDLSVSDIVFSPDHPVQQLVKTYENLLGKEHRNAKEEKELEDIGSEIEVRDAWNYELRIKQILSKLDVHFLDRKIQELSGGQRKRVALAQALINEPDLILMDEPTNHLDLDSIEWLEKFLSSTKQSLLLITHDRYFLETVTTEILELDQGKLFYYEGNYSYFLEKKAEREIAETSEREKARNLFSHELEWLRRSPKARGTKSKSRIDAAEVLRQKTLNPHKQESLTLRIKGRRIGGKILEIKNLRKSFGETQIVDNFSYTFNPKDRIGIVGPNGVGKSTFIQLITEELEADSGKVRKGETIYFGHYRQSGLQFKPDQRVHHIVSELADQVELSQTERISAEKLLEYFLFPRNMHQAKVETLSGGEKRRLHLLRVLMANPNFLILDEPTNDLDLVTLRILEEFLAEFEGCLLIVSHDRYFMDRLVDHIFVFEGGGQIKDFPGSYTEYQRWKDNTSSNGEKPVLTSLNKAPEPDTAIPAIPVNKKKLSYKEQRELENLEPTIAALEEKKLLLQDRLVDANSSYEEIMKTTKELEALEADLDAKILRWMELSEG